MKEDSSIDVVLAVEALVGLWSGVLWVLVVVMSRLHLQSPIHPARELVYRLYPPLTGKLDRIPRSNYMCVGVRMRVRLERMKRLLDGLSDLQPLPTTPSIPHSPSPMLCLSTPFAWATWKSRARTTLVCCCKVEYS